ncbi:MAG TPA: C4-type zinc ribbon domain-containing protein [Chitinophagales bacterium]|nr:C4-type zinc ribbon domain-containing protein [Chitinophagales bacterium]
MSKVKEAPKTDNSVEEKLRALYRLQKIDTKTDDIQILKGELPMEVKDLEDELTGLKTRIGKIEDELKEMEENIANRKNSIKEAESLIKKYQKQQNNVKNNREFDALSKEIELQKLDIQLGEKRIKEATDDMNAKSEYLELSKKAIKEKEKNLKQKKEELEHIIEETDAEEKALLKKSKEQQAKIEERLIQAYHRIRSSYKNGLAVVTVQRDACGGCYNAIPPQTQMEIRQHKKIIVCEHCGRILVDEALEVK